MNRQPRALVSPRRDELVQVTADSMLGTEKRNQFDLGRLGQKIDGGPPVLCLTRMIRQQRHPLAAKPFKALDAQSVDTREHRSHLLCGNRSTRRETCTNRASLPGSVRRHVFDRSRYKRRHPGAKGHDVATPVGVHPVREEHDVDPRQRIHPKRRPRKARMTE